MKKSSKTNMKQWSCLSLAALLAIGTAVCAGAEDSKTAAQAETVTEAASAEWSREGYFLDENEYMLSVVWADYLDEPGWYVGCTLGEDAEEDTWGGVVEQEGDTLHGSLPSAGSREDITVTVSEEDDGGLLLEVQDGETYHFSEVEMGTATIFVTANTEGFGNIEYAEGEEAPEIDPDFPSQSVMINLDEPATHTFVAWPDAGSVFVKWMKDGEDFSTDPQITVLLDESADYVAVFEEDPDWQNPVMNVIGEYQSGRAHATVECFGAEDAWITIEWGSSASETARWDIVGRLDTETMTIEYTGCPMNMITYDENGEEVNREQVREEGSGTIVFGDDQTFTWHEDQSDYEEDMVFEWAFEPETETFTE